MNKCKFWYKFYYIRKKVDLVIKTHKAVQECLKIPTVGVPMAFVVTKNSEVELNRINSMLISGPICGSRKIENGCISDIEY